MNNANTNEMTVNRAVDTTLVKVKEDYYRTNNNNIY